VEEHRGLLYMCQKRDNPPRRVLCSLRFIRVYLPDRTVRSGTVRYVASRSLRCRVGVVA
jgi:hypothetical protein